MKRLLIVCVGLVALGMGLPEDSVRTPKSKISFSPLSTDPKFLAASNRWVDSVFTAMSADERLGQLFMIAAYSNKDARNAVDVEGLIKKYKVGGVIWMQGSPVKQGKLAGYYQSISKVPMLYSMDAEWGLSMRLDSVPRYPRAMTLGAIQNDSLVFYAGQRIARDCKRLGIHINFGPDADVNINPKNPVIGIRSFGEDRDNVARKAAMYMAGMQSEHVLANAKHFPGHGDTETDSHAALPILDHSRQRLDSVELYPFKKLIEQGIGSVMVAHLQIPALDTAANLPASLSPKVINQLLKTELGFNGLVFTDALNMKGAMGLPAGAVEVKALQAGVDVLLMSLDVGKAITAIKLALDSGVLQQADLDEKVKKILKLKYWCGLNKTPSIVTRKITSELNSSAADSLNENLARAAITLLQNNNSFLPFQKTDTTSLLEITVGSDEQTQLFLSLKEVSKIEHAGLSHTATPEQLKTLALKLPPAQRVIIQINRSNLKPDQGFGLSTSSVRLIDSIASIKPTVLVVFGIPYLLNSFQNFSNFKAVLMGYENIPAMQKAAAMVILGIAPVTAKLPVTTNAFSIGSGINMMPLQTSFELLEEKFAAEKFKAVDSIALQGIREKAYPGCQIVALQNGRIVYQKSFGKYTYDSDAKMVDNGTMYDLASLTKVLSSALALMKLSSEGKFDYHKKIKEYLPEYAGSDKGEIVIEDLLAHQAGLPAWIPFYQTTIDKNKGPKSTYYSKKQSEQFPVQVAQNLYAVKGIRDTLVKQIIACKLKERGNYLYSDIGYYFMQQLVEKVSGQSLDTYVKSMYTKTGINLAYQPLNYFSKLQIAPTENDLKFRQQLIHGYVHDPGAAMMGGVAGHAGLFGSALDVAKLMQLYLNKGVLNNQRILDSTVVNDFTSCHFCPSNRRGLCFEKPEPNPSKESPVAAECSLSSYGHSGFTGTFAWADPANKLVIVFLSNRVYPSAEENKLVKLGTRTKIQKAFYDALK